MKLQTDPKTCSGGQAVADRPEELTVAGMMLQTDSRAALILASFFLSSRMASRLAITYSHSTQPVNGSLPYKQRWALLIDLEFSKLPTAIGLKKLYRNIGLATLHFR